MNGTGSGSYAGNSTSACSSGGPAIASTSTSLLAPPPDPPSHLRDTSSRSDQMFWFSFVLLFEYWVARLVILSELYVQRITWLSRKTY